MRAASKNAEPLSAHGWASSPERLAVAAAVTLGFAVLARALRGVNRSGALAGGLACFLLFAGAGPAAFATLAALFLMTWVSTRLGYRRKLALGSPSAGKAGMPGRSWRTWPWPRSAAVVFGVTGNRRWLVAAMAALAEAATDTVASEIGQYRGQDARLITTWERVPAGTDGGITIAGTHRGSGCRFSDCGGRNRGRDFFQSQLWIPVAAGFAGMLIDSLLGATMQRRGWISNQAVNFFSTLAAAALAYAIAMVRRDSRLGCPAERSR